MKPNTSKPRERLPRLLALLAASAAVCGCLALGARTLMAGDGGEEPSAFGGGDAIGSLPCTSPPGPESMTAGSVPSIVLEGPSLATIQSLVLDAYGDGYAEVFDLGEDGVRVELQGDVTVVLDRNSLDTEGFRAGLDVSQGFSGGLGLLLQNQRLLRSQILPAVGDLEVPLQALAGSGVLDTNILTLQSISVQQKHHELSLACSGGTLRMVSRH